MKRPAIVAGSTLSVLLCACVGQNAPPPAVVAPSPATQTVTTATPPHDVTLPCGGADVVLMGTDRDARVETHHGDVARILPSPGGMTGYVPVGLGCATSSHGRAYLVVEYGELPRGCKVCEWFFVYDASGRPLNASEPPMRGEGASIAPNNEGYIELIGTLGLQHPEIRYAESSQTR